MPMPPLPNPSWYCPRCGEPLYVRRVSRYCYRAVCSLRVCDLLPIEWTDREADGLNPPVPPDAIDGDDIGRVAEARARFARVVEREVRDRKVARGKR